MTSEAGLVYEKAAAYRFAVPRFRVIATLKGHIEPSLVLEYLANDLKMKVFTDAGSMRYPLGGEDRSKLHRYRDFALLLFDHVRLNSDPNSTRLVMHANERKASTELPKSSSPECYVTGPVMIAYGNPKWGLLTDRRMADEDKVYTAELYGGLEEGGSWYVDLLVGAPPQRISAIVDTASGITGAACYHCTNCGRHIDPPFRAENSTTLEWMTCNDCLPPAHCSGSQTGSSSEEHSICVYNQNYLEGSAVYGKMFRDVCHLGDTLEDSFACRIGCHDSETNLFQTQKPNAILGLSPQAGGFLDDAFDTTAARTLGLCLSGRGGGRIDIGGEVNDFGGDTKEVLVSSSPGDAVIDSSSTYTYFPDDIFRSLTKTLSTMCANNRCHAESVGDGCWRAKSIRGGMALPDIVLQFEDKVVRWPAVDGYLMKQKSGGLNYHCYAFLKGEKGSEIVLGGSFLRDREVFLDINQKQLGLGRSDKSTCPSYTSRPSLPPYQLVMGWDYQNDVEHWSWYGIGFTIFLASLSVGVIYIVFKTIYRTMHPMPKGWQEVDELTASSLASDSDGVTTDGERSPSSSDSSLVAAE
ncbi:hypothetical protein FOL47_009153 [Perkinsus chesapeaki]|uniref:Peptidase A1 domain-containing protein n=1 Tax=Perkinsus chesapeaki TaxID=330153 RepID=A0A7J6MTC4_PERCH|nr:hypothetical protein FOL47_009153 [Perkinsus chesapeaki]